MPKRIIRALLPASKISPFGYPPELSIPPPATNEDIVKVWQGTVYCDCRASSANGVALPPNFTDETGLGYAVSIRELYYRDTLHEYLREMTSADSVLQALHEDAGRLDTGVPLVARIDLETPVFNAVSTDGSPGRPRTDLFANLQRRYARGRGFRFIFLDEEILDSACSTVIGAPIASKQAIEKWRNDALRDELRLYGGAHKANNPFLYWSALASDYFVRPTDDVLLPATYHGRKGEIRIRCDGKARASELSKKMAALALGVLLADVLKPGDDAHLHRTHGAALSAASLLSQA